MAQRTTSLPPMGRDGAAINPFWSRRVREEAGLRILRPADLPPVPHGEEDEQDLSRETDGEPRAPVENRSDQPRGRSREQAPVRFSTPASWSSAQKQELSGEGLRTEGELPFQKGQDHGEEDLQAAGGLQRELEKEVVQQLHVENQCLRMQIDRLQAEKRMRETPSSWSAVTPEVEHRAHEVAPPPPRSRSPTRRSKEGLGGLRFTPGGTQVPQGPPPMDEVPCPPQLPEWPAFLRSYEVCEAGGPCLNTLGPARVNVFREERGVSLHDAECGRGVDPRYLHDGVYGRGVDPRNLHDKGYGRGVRSRYEAGLVQDRVEREMESMNLKAKWLENEIASFKRALDAEGKRGSSQHWNPEYWSRPAGNHPDRQGDRASNHQDRQGDRASNHQDRQGDRASIHPGCQEDRASIHSGCQEDRASIHQVCQEDRASIHQVLQGDRASTHQDRQGDRAGKQEEGQGSRGAVPQGHLPVGMESSNYGSGIASDQVGSGPKLELPALPGTISPMDLGDWLILVGPVMRDLSQHAAKWWQRTMEETTRYYEIWRTASPLQRVQLQVGLPPDLMVESYGRTEQRGVGLLLRAVPEEMKKALISNRDVTSTAIIWRLLTTFQPGGAGEKSTILKSLTSLQVGSNAAELASAIRQWRRCFQRAQEIGASLPDGTLMVYGLEPGAALLGRLDGQSAFRVASARSELRVDEQPTQESVWAYSQVLLAEAETLHLAGTVAPTTATKPQVKQLGLPVPKAGSQSQTQGACRFWGTESGCKHGRSCKFAHPQLPDFKERCWLCSSTSHRKMDCPARGLGGGPQNASAGGGGGLSSEGSAVNKDSKGGEKGNGGKGQGKKGGKDGKRLEDKPTLNKTVTEATVAEEGKDGKDGKSPRPSTEKRGVAPSTPAAATGETLMGEVAGLLRSLRLQQEPSPALRGCQVRRLGAQDAVRCLLDGGATHCLRQCETEMEWSKGVEVSVSLAQGDV